MRRKAFLRATLSRESTFEALMLSLKAKFQESAAQLERNARMLARQHLDVFKSTLNMLREENVALESERDPGFRDRVAESVASVQVDLRRIQSETEGCQPIPSGPVSLMSTGASHTSSEFSSESPP